MRRLLPLALLAIAVAATTTDGRTPAQAGGPREVAAADGTPDAQPSGAPTADGESDAKTPGRSTRPATTAGSGGFPPPGPGSRNTMRLEVTLNRTCATRGDEMSAHAVTEPGATLAFSAGYAGDNSLIPDFQFVPKDTNVTGEYTWRWVIRPSVPNGDAIVSVVAAKDGKGASYNLPFRIASSC